MWNVGKLEWVNLIAHIPIIPYSEGGLIVFVWEISEGSTEFLYAMKLVSPKDLGFQEPKVSKCHKLSLSLSLSFCSVRTCLESE